MAKKSIHFNEKYDLPIPYKKYKTIKIGSIVCLKSNENSKTKKLLKKVYVIKGSCFSNINTTLPHGSIGIVIGYKYRKSRYTTLTKNKSKKVITNKTKWFQILIENNVYLAPDYDVFLYKK